MPDKCFGNVLFARKGDGTEKVSRKPRKPAYIAGGFTGLVRAKRREKNRCIKANSELVDVSTEFHIWLSGQAGRVLISLRIQEGWNFLSCFKTQFLPQTSSATKMSDPLMSRTSSVQALFQSLILVGFGQIRPEGAEHERSKRPSPHRFAKSRTYSKSQKVRE